MLSRPLHALAADLLCGLATVGHAANPVTAMVTGLQNPESVCIGPKGRVYVAEIRKFDKDGDGRIAVIEDGKARTFYGGHPTVLAVIPRQAGLILSISGSNQFQSRSKHEANEHLAASVSEVRRNISGTPCP